MDPNRLKLPSHTRTSSKEKNDGFDFTPSEKNPGNEPTRPRDVVQEPPTTVQEALLDLSASRGKENQDHVYDKRGHHIYQRKHGGWYARLPDVDIALPAARSAANGTTGRGAVKQDVKNSATHDSTQTTRKDDSTELELMLGWTSARMTGNKSRLQFVDASAPQAIHKKDVPPRENSQPAVRSPVLSLQESDPVRRLFWRHDHHHGLSINKLLSMVQDSKANQLSEGEFGLAKRLTTTLRRLSERTFIGGRYLVPLSMRYDNQDVSKYTIDRTCIFYSFPYLCLDLKARRKYYTKQDEKHPARTLLQSNYRLHDTEDRDDYQCLTWLKPGKLRSCMNAPDAEVAELTGKKARELFFVPQFWGLIVGLDTLITLGVSNEKVLRGGSFDIVRKDDTASDIVLSLIRILFYHKGQAEEVIFPLSQCESCFSLLNKKQQLVEFINEEKPESSIDPNNYHFKRDDNDSVITVHDWDDVLEEARDREMISIRMLENVPSFSFDGPSGSTSPSGDATGAQTPTSVKTIRQRIVTPPFLHWKMQNEFGEEENTPDLAVREAKFLRAILLKLPVPARMSLKERKKRPQDLSERRALTDTEISIQQRTYEDVEEHVKVAATRELAEKLLDKSAELLSMYIPSKHVEADINGEGSSATVRIFWGAVVELISKADRDAQFQEQLKEFLKMLDLLIEKAHLIHRGVRCLRPRKPSMLPLTEDRLAEGVILLSATVDSLGSIMHMFVEAARVAGSRSTKKKKGIMSSHFRVGHYGDEALKHLDNTTGQLIREANDEDKENVIGPVVTAEAISIAIMGRLVSGVYCSGSVDAIGIYEECLEHLTLKVKNEASRRLLQKINAFAEEVRIVIDILNQQNNVLLQFRENLNPKTFQAPSIARKLRYKYECRGIDRLLEKIKENSNSFSELYRRADQLGHENVRLVETLQDDNSKAIFIFTLVTILFLPLTFVAGFFGMNLKGIDSSERDYWHFWKIALPMTAGIVLICTLVTLKGEDAYFAIGRLSRSMKRKK